MSVFLGVHVVEGDASKDTPSTNNAIAMMLLRGLSLPQESLKPLSIRPLERPSQTVAPGQAMTESRGILGMRSSLTLKEPPVPR